MRWPPEPVASGAPIGSSSYMTVRPEHGGLEARLAEKAGVGAGA